MAIFALVFKMEGTQTYSSTDRTESVLGGWGGRQWRQVHKVANPEHIGEEGILRSPWGNANARHSDVPLHNQ